MSSGTHTFSSRVADAILFAMSVAFIFWLVVETVVRHMPRDEPTCYPGYVMSTHAKDGTLRCFYERTDWRYPLKEEQWRSVIQGSATKSGRK